MQELLKNLFLKQKKLIFPKVLSKIMFLKDIYILQSFTFKLY